MAFLKGRVKVSRPPPAPAELVAFDPHGTVEYAFEAKAIQRPSLLIIGRLFVISTRMLAGDGVP